MSTPPIEGVDVQMGNDHGACHYLLAFRPVAWSRLPCEDQYDHANLVSLERLSHGVLNRTHRSTEPKSITHDPRAMENGLLGNQAYSGRRIATVGHGTNVKQEKANTSKSRWPHALNVVTNFSKPPQLAQRAADTNRRPEQGAVDAFQRGHKRSNSSANIKTPDAYKGGENKPSHRGKDGNNYDADLGLVSKRFESTRKAPSPPRDIKGPVHELLRASSKMTTLSPSDRPIVIGISVPSDSLNEHTISPDVGPTPVSIFNQQYMADRRPSDAPTIVVTPVKVTAPSSAKSNDRQEPARRRAPSSLYSRATNAQGTPKPSEVPPVPSVRKRSLPSPIHVEPNLRRPDMRLISTYTVFDEDRDENNSERPRSGDSQLRILKRSSTDSIATRRRSQGWWNHIVSPFLPRPGSIPWRSGSRESAPVPDLPDQALTIGSLGAQHSSQRASKSRRSNSNHTSILTDMSPVETERLPEDVTLLHSPFHEGLRECENSHDNLSDWFEGLGAAAEYYHGCWHDQHYSTPYFDCQNHICISRRIGNFPVPEGERDQLRELPTKAGLKREIATAELPKHGESDGFQQAPGNRFSAAFGAAATSGKPAVRVRPLSETTVIEDVDATPVIEKAQLAPVVRVPAPVPAAQPSPPEPKADVLKTKEVPEASPPDHKALRQPLPMEPPEPSGVESTGNDLPARSPPRAEKPAKRFFAVMPPDHPLVKPRSPESSTASPQQNEPVLNSHSSNEGATNNEPTSNISRKAVPTTLVNHYHHIPYREPKSDQVSLADMEPPPRPAWSAREVHEFRGDEKTNRQTNESHRGPSKLTACMNRGKSSKPKTKKQKWLLIGIASALVAMILLIVLLALFLTRKGDHMDVQSQWLNLTGFPPIPTGVSTIVQPDMVQEAPGCIQPKTLWSCAVPKEQQAAIAPNAPNQPNFRIEIRFQNGSVAQGAGTNSTALQSRSRLRLSNTAVAGRIVRKRLLRARDFTSSLFSPSPSPPSREDQIFLGNTTDNNQQPFDGVATPFFISFLSTEKLPSLRKSKRESDASDTNSTGNSTNSFPNLESVIPPPSTDPDGTASSALLTPYLSAQPLRLYDRDTESEHYGFYTYFDRSIFLKSTALLNFTGASPSEIPDDENGGANESAAKVRCTWAQTRFLIQMWTRKGNNAPLLRSSNSSTDSSPDAHPKNLTLSSANNFTRPGSFPYPVSITLDRHGGDIKKKMIYCYGLDQQEYIISDEKQIQLEDRGSGGNLVNPAQGPFGEVKVSGDDGGPGGIDGGHGGCGCKWENFSR
ncbi:hypothetical protein Q9189_004077 [Teloschistes chrysophthalmus]